MIKKEISMLELHYQVLKFLKDHKEDYAEEEKEMILKNYAWGKKEKVLVPDILRQIYDELDLLSPTKNIYLGFLKLIEKNFSIDGNLVELGGGRIPSLAKKIALQQKNGTITVYDDKLITTTSKQENLILKKERLKSDTDINADLLVAFMPCEGTKTAFSIAKKNNLDFIVAFCEGSCHQEETDLFGDDWENDMLFEARKAVREGNLGTLEMTNMEEYNNPYLVVYNNRKKKTYVNHK